MKNRKFLWLAIAISIAFPLTAKAEDLDAAGYNILWPGVLLTDINDCKATLNNLDKLLKFSQQLVDATHAKYNANPNDPEAKAAYDAATSDYSKLTDWHERVSGRLMVEMHTMEQFNSRNASRDAAKDATDAARQAATDGARQTGAEAARGSMENCPHGGGGCH